jgi:hypothetical protein
MTVKHSRTLPRVKKRRRYWLCLLERDSLIAAGNAGGLWFTDVIQLPSSEQGAYLSEAQKETEFLSFYYLQCKLDYSYLGPGFPTCVIAILSSSRVFR